MRRAQRLRRQYVCGRNEHPRITAVLGSRCDSRVVLQPVPFGGYAAPHELSVAYKARVR
jgi:hypothetical protein